MMAEDNMPIEPILKKRGSNKTLSSNNTNLEMAKNNGPLKCGIGGGGSKEITITIATVEKESFTCNDRCHLAEDSCFLKLMVMLTDGRVQI